MESETRELPSGRRLRFSVVRSVLKVFVQSASQRLQQGIAGVELDVVDSMEPSSSKFSFRTASLWV